jgi:hypothetical protein
MVSVLRRAVAGQESGQVRELAGEVELLKQKVGAIDSIRKDLNLAAAGISLLAAVPNTGLTRILARRRQEKCTFATTGRDFVYQPVWHCRTCGLVGEIGCCAACALICHEGHDVYFDPSNKGRFYCDCGAGDGPRPCRCLK